jgi:Glycosyl transferase family 2
MRVQGDATSSNPDIRVVAVITAFNGHDPIVACIESVLCQDYSHVEQIILDGGSTDRTVMSTAGLYEALRAKMTASARHPCTVVFDLRRAIVRLHVRRTFLKLSSRVFPLSRERNWRAT